MNFFRPNQGRDKQPQPLAGGKGEAKKHRNTALRKMAAPVCMAFPLSFSVVVRVPYPAIVVIKNE